MNRTHYIAIMALVSLFACNSRKIEPKPTQQTNLPAPPLNQVVDKSEAESPLVSRKDIGQKKEQGEVKGMLRANEYLTMGSASVYKSKHDMRCLPATYPPADFNTEQYDNITENIFHEATKNPLSTFSIDVDGASYANARRFITSNQLPPKDAVRIEEFINYFPYSYKAPKNSDPVSIQAEVAGCPWNFQNRLVRIGLKGKEIKTEGLPASNLVFLIDVSGSMQTPNKLPLVKSALHMLVNQLREKDRVSMVVYAGSAGLVLPPTYGSHKEEISAAIDRLEAGGSTAGGAGIKLAYEVAKKNFFKHGNNRVILASDGDFNVGTSSDGELVQLIEEKRKDGIFLTVLGFGMGNYKDSKMEKLADKGNGNYAYIDNILEAKKVFVNEMGATLHTIAKDVKIQVEFNPALVQEYRLVGYENRLLNDEDFNDDKKDAGEMGAGGTVTALYEIVPVGAPSKSGRMDPLKYLTHVVSSHAGESDELLTVKFRYKEPTGTTSKMVSLVVKDRGTELSETSDDFRFAVSAAGLGMLLRDSEFKNDLTYDHVARLAKDALGEDPEGYRAEFLRIVKLAQALQLSQHAMR